MAHLLHRKDCGAGVDWSVDSYYILNHPRVSSMSYEEEIVTRDVTNAGLVVSDSIGREVAAQVDLEEALEASRYANHPYSTHPRELQLLMFSWLLSSCYGALDGHCPEYSVEEQAICAVGLAKSKPGVFIEAMQNLLILATSVELILVGGCCSGGVDGTDPYAEVSLQPLPEYTIPSDIVTMTCITCTDKGRIFLAGRDGHIYELHYTTGSGWQKRCRKVCLTAGLSSVISRWVVLNVFKFGAVDLIIEMVVDNERQILRMYLSTSPSSGSNGVGGLRGFNGSHKPSCLKVVTTRPSPPLGVSGALAFGSISLAGRTQNEDFSLKVENAYYSAGTLVLSDSSPPTMSCLLIVNRDASSQSSFSVSLGVSARSSRALRETVCSLPIEGQMLYVADVLPLPDIATIVHSLRQYLSNAVLQAKNASNYDGAGGSSRGVFDNGLLDLLEGKHAVLQFQIKIKDELETIASRSEAYPGPSESMQNGSVPMTLLLMMQIWQTLQQKRLRSYL
ncbi:hypothetical protein HS088_TW05G00775 [Tripterygium wilfordii]|uniref:Nucleoporin Nup133/Nup155-like N-terminal domain-containing protein n=1 Tax=Tripterygium wilfordii TaxID=458696 RepID=A0A7J7DP37_TRIWF|nr:hypothetical protein HS088_TW05G00775 [Tripterygium wilfordii]